METISNIRAHINRLPRDAIFTSRDFLCYGKRTTVDSAVNRLIAKEMIFRIARGVFVKWSAKVAIRGILPSALEVARAKCRGFGKSVFTHKKDAAHHLGLIEAGNENPTFSTFGRNSSFQYGDKKIQLLHVSPKDAHLADRFAGLFTRALKQVGNHKELPSTICRLLGSLFSRIDRQETHLAAAYQPSWISEHLLDGRYAGLRIKNLTRTRKIMHKFLRGYQRVFMIERTVSPTAE
jgi:hypothetical protein